MIAAPQHGFVFLAAAKAGSTSIERSFGQLGLLVTRGSPELKHTSAAEFEQWVAPWLAAHGFGRDTYETVAMIREPVDLVASWWRYRARPGVAPERSTAQMSFDEFTEQVVAGRAAFRKPAGWLCGDGDEVLVDRLYRYEHLDRAVAWMAERSGTDADVPRLNTSEPRHLDVSPAARARLEEYFARELEIYASAR